MWSIPILPVISTVHFAKPKKLNSEALVRERTILTERPSLVGEVIANFFRIELFHVVSAADYLRP
jgi:hypothetical protein